MAVLVDQDQPMIWRGPMVPSALEQLLNETQWRELDYLLIDLPPGTDDIQLTMSQKIPISGAIIDHPAGYRLARCAAWLKNV